MSGLLRLYEDWIVRLLILASFILMGAGGLGLATSVGLIGLLLLPVIGFAALRAGRAAVEPIIYALVAICWISLSLVWSPYEKPDQVLKFFLLTPFFGLAVFACARLNDERAQDRLAWASVCAGLLALYFLIEAATGSFLSLQYKLAFEDVQDPVEVARLADRILGRGTTAFVLVAGPIVLTLWVYGGRLAKAIAVGIGFSALAGSFAFGIEANALSLVLGVLAGAVAWCFPRSALQIGFWFAGGIIIAAPLVMGAMLSLLPASFIEALPVSWAMRIEIWRFAMEQIAAAPLTGHGLDASRVISETGEIRGVEFDRLPLHAHNAGLTIWLETGAVGAILVGGTIISIGQLLARRLLAPIHAASIAYACAAFFATVMVGSGIWQEWLHAALAFALGITALIRRDTGSELA